MFHSISSYWKYHPPHLPSPGPLEQFMGAKPDCITSVFLTTSLTSWVWACCQKCGMRQDVESARRPLMLWLANASSGSRTWKGYCSGCALCSSPPTKASVHLPLWCDPQEGNALNRNFQISVPSSLHFCKMGGLRSHWASGKRCSYSFGTPEIFWRLFLWIS